MKHSTRVFADTSSTLLVSFFCREPWRCYLLARGLWMAIIQQESSRASFSLGGELVSLGVWLLFLKSLVFQDSLPTLFFNTHDGLWKENK